MGAVVTASGTGAEMNAGSIFDSALACGSGSMGNNSGILSRWDAYQDSRRKRALEVYPSAELKILPGAGHGLHGQDAQTAADYMLEYLQRHCR